ncbi:MAG: hypothetical protein HPY73_00870 [Methanomassiliicoccales archaeon]|nr:MAG: hypothetical protein HPY73_00870 [Methanomassiliicoccales archaeon]
MRTSKKISMSPKEVLDLAEKMFSGEGLRTTDRAPNRICMENEMGFVTIQIKTITNGDLCIMAQGFDELVNEFISLLR